MHTAGTVGAVGDNGTGVTGVNWHVQVMTLKFLNDNRNGSTSDAIAELSYAVARACASPTTVGAAADTPRRSTAPPTTPGWPGISSSLRRRQTLTLFYPASYNLASIIAVAAVDSAGGISSFSNYGATRVDLAALGKNILSTAPWVAAPAGKTITGDVGDAAAAPTGACPGGADRDILAHTDTRTNYAVDISSII
jgi:hypothetical protein